MAHSTGASALTTSNRFFGIASSSVGQDLLIAWRTMLEWPVLSWLWPKLPVRLWLPTGSQALSRSLDTPAVQDEQRTRSARFEAVLLPENLLLRRTLNLPRLQRQELMAALHLEVQTINPFELNDVVWAHEITQQESASLQAHLVLASRKLIAKQIAAIHPHFEAQTSEVWVASMSGVGFVMLPGYGEALRQRQSNLWRWASALLAVMVFALIAAIALTPSAQLYLRAVHAHKSMMELQQKAAPVIAQRESLVRATDQLTSLGQLIGQPPSPLQTLKLITDALPDDTSLLSLQIQGFKVNISGQTANASALMKQLGSTPGLGDVKAPTPATKPLGAPRESFTIEFTLDPAQLRPSP